VVGKFIRKALDKRGERKKEVAGLWDGAFLNSIEEITGEIINLASVWCKKT